MGKSYSKLPHYIVDYAEKVFDQLDQKMTGQVDRAETLNVWVSNFNKVDLINMLDQVDRNNDGKITKKEWIDFWTHIYNSGYNEQDIITQLNIMEQQKTGFISYRNTMQTSFSPGVSGLPDSHGGEENIRGSQTYSTPQQIAFSGDHDENLNKNVTPGTSGISSSTKDLYDQPS